MEKIVPIGETKEEAISYLEKEKNNLWSNAEEEIAKLIQFIEAN